MLFRKILLVLLFYIPFNRTISQRGEMVKHWADTFGNELFSLGKIITKSEEIKSRYKFLNAQVEEKDPQVLLKEIVTSLTRMMDRKMDAIMCIMEQAEKAAAEFELDVSENFTYYNSKLSTIIVEGMPVDQPQLDPEPITECLNSKAYLRKTMYMNTDTHFYNLAVNTSHSSVHVPTNIFDLSNETRTAIQWSEMLDEIFVKNYKSDPALSWQYFGSSTGIMRHYPAMQWSKFEEENIDIFDCRIRPWFIEAATCTKDIIILLDNSGSMHGMGKHVASLTVSSILDTFSNNDFVNIITYNDTTQFLVPCFEDLLVQATKENIQVFKDAISRLVPDEKSYLEKALEKAFVLLETYREKKNCTVSDCNQAIMVVTDGVSDETEKAIEQHNAPGNDSNIPVRIFTYLIGKEVDNNILAQMACKNRGYYAQIQGLEQVTESVFQYVPVIARPLVLYGEHPASWTHAYPDITYDDSRDDQINEPYRLLTSVAVPAFDKKVNNNNDSRVAKLLGVAATDVPIDDIQKLTLPYKIGVNAYAFIVSNNGYLLMHPDLRPVYNKTLKVNCNSVDLMDVEQMDDDVKPRELGPYDRPIRQLRLNMVNGLQGTMQDIKIKYHYDKMRRVSRESYDYYYAPIEETPFTIGLAIPEEYGRYSLEVEDEIKRNRHTGANITSFFTGSNWKVHPKWVYCKYHYLEGHEYPNAEEELLHFLNKIDEGNINFKWQRQYEAYGSEEEENFKSIDCGVNTLNDDDYYCDKQLMERLIFDAKNTMEAFKNPWKFDDREEELFRKYNATLRFVATMSGLTRWEYIFGENNNVNIKEFGDYHAYAIDEVWYKSAVLQHEDNNEAFVYSVPFESDEDENEILVTGSYAIFPTDASKEAPGSVVGFQFSHSHMKHRLKNIIRRSGDWCLECVYIIDSSGYIILSYSDKSPDTGRFFGEVQPEVMESMLQANIFEKITVYDYQALCFDEDDEPYSCENKIDLFILQQEQHKFKYYENTTGPKTFYIKHIPYSNLLFIHISNPEIATEVPKYSTKPTNITEKSNLVCKKLFLNELERRRLTGCFNYHELEHEIRECGIASKTSASNLILGVVLILINL